MPLHFDIKKKLTARLDRVKSVDLHPTEPWMVVSLYTGPIVVWNHHTQAIVKTFKDCIVPIRTAKFIARKHWVIAGGDDMMIRVFNYNTLARVHTFKAHQDYIRCIAVHPMQPYILTSSDDMLIKLWNWERKWMCIQVCEGHSHYVMDVVFNPKDNNQFASASMDRTVKVWQLGSKSPNFTLEGHDKGVNCVSYYSGGDKPYLISGADDCLAKIWDYQNKTCIHTLEGHTNNINCVSFFPQLPIILTGSEDGTIRVWHRNTYRLESTLDYNLERVWCLCTKPFSNIVALGFDNGTMVIQLGRDEPAMSMDSSGKILWARGPELQQANLKTMGEADVRDGEKLLLGVKDMGSSEIQPQTMQHSPNGRFVAICGDGEYIIYTAMALRNKSFGSAQEFVWAHDSSQYAIREGNTLVKIFTNFKESAAFKVDFGAEGIFGGVLLGVKSRSGLAFYDWEQAELIRRIDIQPKHIFWSASGELVSIVTDESFFVLRYLPEEAAAAKESKTEMTQDGMEGTFEVLAEVPEGAKTGLWVGDCFIYTSPLNRLNYFVGGKIVTIAHLDRTMYLLGYIPKDNHLYLGDIELNVVRYLLVLSVLEYQTAVMRKDFSTADRVLPTIPREQRIRVAYFLEEQGFKQQALAVSTDPEHKFELALQLGDVQTAQELALEAKHLGLQSEQKWRQLAKLATTMCQFSIAQECLLQAQDYGGLLLLATASGSSRIMENLAEGTERNEKTNVAFLTYFLQGRLEKCLDLLIKTDRLPEAAFLARTYLPSHVSRVVKLWKESLSKVNQKAANSLADPTAYSNLFPGLQQALVAEQYLKEATARALPAANYPLTTPNEKRNVLQESAGFVSPKITEPKIYQQEVTRGRTEQVRGVAAASEELKEELNPPKEEITGPLPKSEGESKTLASGHPRRETENVEPKPVECDQRASAGCKDFLEEVVLEAFGESIPSKIVKPFPLEDTTSSFQSEVQMISLADGTLFSASETKLESIETTDGKPSKILVGVDPTACAGESLATSLISPQAFVNMAAEKICAQKELVSEGSALVEPAVESVSSENTANRDSGGPDLAQNFTELAFNPLDPRKEQKQVRKLVGTQEQDEEKPEKNLKRSAPLGAELRVPAFDRAQSERNTATKPDGARDKEEGNQEEAKLDEKSASPDDAAFSAAYGVINAQEKPRALFSPDLTPDVSESATDKSVHKKTETDSILSEASLLVNIVKSEIDATHGQVADTPPLAPPLEDPILSESTASTAPSDPAVLDPLDGRTRVVKQLVAQEEETQATGSEGNQEPAAPLGTELRISYPESAATEGNIYTDVAGSSVEDEDVKAELCDKNIPPGEGALSTTSEVAQTVEKLREVSAMEETLVCLIMTSDVAESAAAYSVVEPDVGASIFVKTADEACVTDAQVLDASPLVTSPEASIFSGNTANRDSDGLELAEDFVKLASDLLLDPNREEQQVIKSIGTQEHEEERQEDHEKCSASLRGGLRVSPSDQACWSERNTDRNPDGAGDEEKKEAEVDGTSASADEGALSAAYGVIQNAQEKPRALFSPDLTLDVSESAADRSVHKKTETDLILSEASLPLTIVKGEIDATHGQVADTPPFVPSLEDPILSKSTASPAPSGPAQVQSFTELTLDPLDGRTQVLKTLVAQEEETQTPGPGGNQVPAAPLETLPRVSSPEGPSAERNTDTEIAGSSVKDEDEDVTAELCDKNISQGDGALSTTSEVTQIGERPRGMSAVEETLVCTDQTPDVAGSAAAARTEMGLDVIPLRASLIVKRPEHETCVTEAQVSDTSPLLSPQKEAIFSKSAIRPLLSGFEQGQTFTNLTLEPLSCPSECARATEEPSEQEQKTLTTGLSKDSQEVGTPIAEPRVKSTDVALLKDDVTGQECQPRGSDGPTKNLETELDDEVGDVFVLQDVVPVDEPLSASPETIEITDERTSETSSPEEIFVGVDWAVSGESSAGEENVTREKLESDAEVLFRTDEVYLTELVEKENKLVDNAAIPVPRGPALAQTFAKLIFNPLGERSQIKKEQEEETPTTVPLPEEPGEESKAIGDSGEPALTDTFTELASDQPLDLPRDQAQIMKPAVVQEPEEIKHDDNQKPATTPRAELRFSYLDGAVTDQSIAEEDVETEVDVEVFDDLDLDDSDLEDIDTSDVNLDEELLGD